GGARSKSPAAADLGPDRSLGQGPLAPDRRMAAPGLRPDPRVARRQLEEDGRGPSGRPPHPARRLVAGEAAGGTLRRPQKADLPPLSKELILELADAHHRRTGCWPRHDSGPIVGAPGETWNGVDTALARGLRNLPGNSSLAKLLAKHRGVRNKAD